MKEALFGGNPSGRRSAIGVWLGAAVCAAWAFLLCFRSGLRGFFAMDQSIVFDGGWRILQGQVPFVDFVLPHGPLSFWIQALFFRFLGVDYLSYVLTAAILNSLGACLAYATFRALVPGNLWPAWAAGLITGSWLYAPMATPYIEQTAFLALWLGIWSAAQAISETGPRVRVWWFLAGLALAGAMVAKTNAGLLAAPSLVGMVWLSPSRGWRGRLADGLTMALGCGFGLAIFCLWLFSVSDPEVFYHYVFEIAGQEGRRRILENKEFYFVVCSLFNGKGNDLIRTATVSAYVLCGLVWTASWGPGRHLRENAMLRSTAGLGLLWIGYQQVFGVTSNNNGINEQPLIGLIFVSLVVLLQHLAKARARNDGAKTSWAPFWRKSFWAMAGLAVGFTIFFYAKGIRGMGNFAFAGGVLLAGLLFVLATGTGTQGRKFPRWLNQALAVLLLGAVLAIGAWGSYFRQAQDPFGSQTRFVAHEGIPGLRGLAWAEGVNPDAVNLHPSWQDLVKVWTILEQSPGRFYLRGNHTFLYALTGKPSVGPLSWFFKGLTYSTQYDPEFDRRFAAEVDQPDMTFFVVEVDGFPEKSGNSPSMKFPEPLTDFPCLKEVLRTRYRKMEKVGMFEIHRRIPAGEASSAAPHPAQPSPK